MTTGNKIEVLITAATGGFARDMARAVGISEQAANRMQATFARVGSTLAALGAGASVGGLALMVKSVVDTGDALAKMSARTGVAVEDLSRLQYAAKLSDVSTDDLGNALTRLNRVMGEAKDGSKEATEALQRFGIDTKTGISTAEALRVIAERTKNTADATRSASALNDVFGKSWATLVPLLKGGADSLKQAGDEADRLGVVMSAEQAKAAEQFADNITRLGQSLEGLKRSLVGPLLPTLERFTEQMVEGIAIAGSFSEALLLFGTTNPFETPAEGIRSLQRDLDAARVSLTGALNIGDDDGVRTAERRVEAIRKQIEFLKLLQRQQVLADSGENFGNEGRGRAQANAAGPGIEAAAAKVDKVTAAGKRAEQAIADLNKRLAALAAEAGDEQTVSVATVTRQYDAAIEQRRAEMDRMAEERMEAQRLETEGEEAVREAIERSTRAAENQSAVAADLGFTFASAFEEAVIAGNKLSDVLQGLAQDIQRIILRRMVTEPLAGAISGGLSGLFGGGATGGGEAFFARGGVVAGSGIGAFSGSMVSQPTIFPFATGIGLMGEAGPEAILPLRRGPSGKLGVEAAVSGTSVVINNYTGQPATTRETADGRGGRRIEVTVGEMVGSEMQRAGSGANRALRNGFGLSPMLVRR